MMRLLAAPHCLFQRCWAPFAQDWGVLLELLQAGQQGRQRVLRRKQQVHQQQWGW
jgi:hypothetical protein